MNNFRLVTIKCLMFIVCVNIIFSGCSSFYSNYPSSSDIYKSQLDAMREDNYRKKADIDKRMSEIESAYKSGSITEGEYLILKNNLKKELSDYAANQLRIAHDLGIEANNRYRRYSY